MHPTEIIIRKLSVPETAQYLSVSQSWLNKKRLSGGGPPYLKLGRRVVYDLADLDAWAAGNKRQDTSQSVIAPLRYPKQPP